MWIVIENGEVFEGDEEEFMDHLDPRPDRPMQTVTEAFVRQVCEEEQWDVKIYARKEHAWN